MSSRQITVFALVAMSACLVAASARGEDTDVRSFAGIWEGRHQGKVYTVVKVEVSDILNGSITTGVIRANDAGEILDVEEEANGEHALLDARFERGRLCFRTSAPDEGTQYEMTVTGKGEAELRIVGSPVRLRPFRLTKAKKPLVLQLARMFR